MFVIMGVYENFVLLLFGDVFFVVVNVFYFGGKVFGVVLWYVVEYVLVFW